MLQYLEFLRIPAYVITGIISLLVVANIVGAILDIKGVVVPGFMSLRKHIMRKKSQKAALQQLPDIICKFQSLDIEKFQATVDEFNSHYDKDNIQKRNTWMSGVNQHIDNSEPVLKEIKADLLELKIEHMRSAILDFAAKVIKEDYPATREQFNRIFKQYARYEEIIEQNKLTNGEVDIAHRIIQDAYEARLRDSLFIEDIRGYNAKN